jgi:hypothetical protein
MARTFPQCHTEARDLLHRCNPPPSGWPLRFVAVISVRYLLPGVGGGAGGELERTMVFTLLHDDKLEKLLLHLGSTNAFFTLNKERTLGDLVCYFLRGKPLTVKNSTEDLLAETLEALQPRYLGNVDMLAY